MNCPNCKHPVGNHMNSAGATYTKWGCLKISCKCELTCEQALLAAQRAVFDQRLGVLKREAASYSPHTPRGKQNIVTNQAVLAEVEHLYRVLGLELCPTTGQSAVECECAECSVPF